MKLVLPHRVEPMHKMLIQHLLIEGNLQKNCPYLYYFRNVIEHVNSVRNAQILLPISRTDVGATINAGPVLRLFSFIYSK